MLILEENLRRHLEVFNFNCTLSCEQLLTEPLTVQELN